MSHAGINGYTQRTTSTFTTHGGSVGNGTDGPNDSDPNSTGGNGWNSFNGTSGEGFSESGLGSGFGSSGDGPNPPNSNTPRPTGSGSFSRGSDEIITVTMLPEKEGMFMFQHRNYEVKSIRRGATVVRRYSDFVWLLDCLHKRYPFRQLPLLPPKRVQGKSSFSLFNRSG